MAAAVAAVVAISVDVALSDDGSTKGTNSACGGGETGSSSSFIALPASK